MIEQLGFLALGSRLRRIYEKLQIDGDKVYTEMGLDFKSSWFPVFYVLAQSKSPQTIMGITAQIAFSHITVKNIIRELEQKKLIKIGPNPNDGRSKLVSLSEHGHSLLQDLEPVWLSFSNVLSDIFAKGHPDMLNILSRIDTALNTIPLHERINKLVKQDITIRNAEFSEFAEIGKLMVAVYSQLNRFPKPKEQPAYYEMLANIGNLTKKPATELLVAVSKTGRICGGVVYFSDMKYYGSGGTATQVKNAAGFRLLAVHPALRGQGIGKLLTNFCIEKAKEQKQEQLIIHTTMSMQIAWKMYENLGFERSLDLDFMQEKLQVYGFRLFL